MLVAIGVDEITQFVAGKPLDRPAAPGWPHENTLNGFSFARTGGSQFLVIDDQGRVAGECGTKSPPDQAGTVEIGYGLAPASRGQGLGRRAVAELVAWLAEQPEVRTIEAEIQISNAPSRRVVEQLGFRASGPPQQGYLRYQRLARPEG